MLVLAFSVVTSLAMMITQLGAGVLGEVQPYRWVSLLFAVVAVEPIFDKELRA